jgi:hypothetical protein
LAKRQICQFRTDTLSVLCPSELAFIAVTAFNLRS